MSLKEAQNIAEKGLSFEIIKASGQFPSLDILNAFFQFGHDDMKEQKVLNWPPFTLSQIQYDEFHYWCSRMWGELSITNLECQPSDFNSWFTKANQLSLSTTLEESQ